MGSFPAVHPGFAGTSPRGPAGEITGTGALPADQLFDGAGRWR